MKTDLILFDDKIKDLESYENLENRADYWDFKGTKLTCTREEKVYFCKDIWEIKKNYYIFFVKWNNEFLVEIL